MLHFLIFIQQHLSEILFLVVVFTDNELSYIADGQWYFRLHVWTDTHDGAAKPDVEGAEIEQERKSWNGTLFTLSVLFM